MIVIVFGLPGSGKSFFASRLAERIRASYLGSDKLRKELLPVRTYSDEEKEMVYQVMLDKAKQISRNNEDVVVDATFYKRSLRDKVLQDTAGVELVRWIEIRADEDLIQDRLIRPRIESEADYNVYLKLKKDWEPMDEDHLVLRSTNENLESLLETAIDYLNTPYAGKRDL